MTGIEIFRIVGELKSFIEWFIYIKKRDVTTVRFLIDCVQQSLNKQNNNKKLYARL